MTMVSKPVPPSIAVARVVQAPVVNAPPAGVSFLLRDAFSTSRAAGSVDGTNAEPGPGTRIVTDTLSCMSLAGGNVNATNRNGANDPGIRYSETAARATGLAMIVRPIIPTAGNWHAAPYVSGGTYLYGGVAWTTSALNYYHGAQVNILSGLSSGQNIWAAIVLRPTGKYIFGKEIGGDWIVGFVDNYDTVDPCHFKHGVFTSAPNCDVLADCRVAQLSTPFDSDFGIATDHLSGARTAGDTFTHEADAWLQFVVQTLPSAGQIEVRFRVQDASNYWQVTVDSAGDVDLDEVVAGAPTQRGTKAGTVANGHRVSVRMVDDQINVYSQNAGSPGNADISYSSATNFKTETDGELETEGTGGAVTDIVTWPRTLGTAAATELNKYSV
jgi:hypothetical protein